MLLLDAEKLAVQLIKKHGLKNWTYSTNSRKRTLGLCFSHEKRIELSVYFIEHNTPAVVKETILHEIAHALVGSKHGHSAIWMEMAAHLGCQPRRKNPKAVMPPGAWQATCGGCGQLFSKHRKPKYISGSSCRLCGPKLGLLRYIKTELVQKIPKGAAAQRGR